MTLFSFASKVHYQKCFDVFMAKCGEREKIVEILRDHIPSLIQKNVEARSVNQQQSRFNILSVGSGTGDMDMEIMKIIKDELQKSEQGRQVKLFNRAIEPSEYSCGRYKDATANLPSPLNDQLTEIEIFRQTFQEYTKSQDKAMKFDMVHFIHSIYYVDIEPALIHCIEKELSDQGFFACILEKQDLLCRVILKQKMQWQGEGSESEGLPTAEKLIKIANDNGWKHEIYNQEYHIDVTEVFDEKSTEGNLLLDFLTYTMNFREKADKQLVEETLALIKDLTTVKDGKRLGDKKESLVFIYK